MCWWAALWKWVIERLRKEVVPKGFHTTGKTPKHNLMYQQPPFGEGQYSRCLSAAALCKEVRQPISQAR